MSARVGPIAKLLPLHLTLTTFQSFVLPNFRFLVQETKKQNKQTKHQSAHIHITHTTTWNLEWHSRQSTNDRESDGIDKIMFSSPQHTHTHEQWQLLCVLFRPHRTNFNLYISISIFSSSFVSLLCLPWDRAFAVDKSPPFHPYFPLVFAAFCSQNMRPHIGMPWNSVRMFVFQFQANCAMGTIQRTDNATERRARRIEQQTRCKNAMKNNDN